MTNGDDKCEIYFNQGQASYAAYGRLRRRTVSKCLRWTEGNFQIDFKAKSRRRRDLIRRPADGRMRLLDESQRDAAA